MFKEVEIFLQCTSVALQNWRDCLYFMWKTQSLLWQQYVTTV